MNSNIDDFTLIEMQGDAPSCHARRTVENLIANHVADAYAIEHLAHLLYREATSMGLYSAQWKKMGEDAKAFWLKKAKRKVLDWLNCEQGTDYRMED